MRCDVEGHQKMGAEGSGERGVDGDEGKSEQKSTEGASCCHKAKMHWSSGSLGLRLVLTFLLEALSWQYTPAWEELRGEKWCHGPQSPPRPQFALRTWSLSNPPSLPITELRGVQGGNEGQRSPVSHTREAGRTECPSVTRPPTTPPSLHCLPALLGSWQVALLGPPWKPLASPFSGVPLRAWGCWRAPPSAEVWVCLSFPPQIGPGSDVWVYSPKTPTPRPIDRRSALLGCCQFYPWRSL